MISNEKRNTNYFTKTPYFKATFKISHYTEQQQKRLTMLNFQHSQSTQNEFEKLVDLLLSYPTAIQQFVQQLIQHLSLMLRDKFTTTSTLET